MSNLAVRIISAVILGAIVLALTFVGGLPFRALAILAGAGILFEWGSITGVLHDRLRATISGAGYGAVALVIVSGTSQTVLWMIFATAVLACAAADTVRNGGIWSAGGLFYAGFSAIALSFLRDDGHGLVTLSYLFAVVWSTDIFAYFAGRAFGGPKLAPRISPNKTWSGAVGGTVCAVIAGTLVAAIAGRGVAFAVPALSFALSAASQLGDLFESWVKRKFGRKDASHIIPGHGGIMDRVDGLVIAAMTLYLSFIFWNQPGFLAIDR